MDEAKELWVKYLHEIICSYHTTPHLTTKEPPFRVVYGVDLMIPEEVNSTTWRWLNFDKDLNKEGLNNDADFI